MASKTDNTIPTVTLRQWYIGNDDVGAFRQLAQRGDHRLTDGFLPEYYQEYSVYSWIMGMVDNMVYGNELHYAVDVDGKAVGCLNVSRCGGDYRHTGILRLILLPDYCSKGIGTKAIDLLMRTIRRKYFDNDFVFEDSFERLEAQVVGDNKAAIRVLEKSGFDYEGTLRNAICKHGKRYDMNMYGYVFRSHGFPDKDSMPEDRGERIQLMHEILNKI